MKDLAIFKRICYHSLIKSNIIKFKKWIPILMKIAIDWIDDFGFTTKVRHFKNFLIDEPFSFKGRDRGPSPVEYILIGIGGCLGISFIHCSKKNNLKINKLNIIVDGKMIHNPPSNQLQLVNVSVELNIVQFEKKEKKKLEKCINTYRKYCIVSNSLIKGLPIDVNVNY